MNEEQLTILGNDAEALLNTEAFTKTMNTMVDATVQAFLGSAPDEADKRTEAYGHYRALVDIINTLRQQVEVRDQIDAKLNEEETTEEE
jgi:hypothetical protein|tara:strand:+ start:7659 stop:7925 length:267 start_codon:yes stop_codon:yes gene_type:complete